MGPWTVDAAGHGFSSASGDLRGVLGTRPDSAPRLLKACLPGAGRKARRWGRMDWTSLSGCLEAQLSGHTGTCRVHAGALLPVSHSCKEAAGEGGGCTGIQGEADRKRGRL